jgi:hypothetical protein
MCYELFNVYLVWNCFSLTMIYKRSSKTLSWLSIYEAITVPPSVTSVTTLCSLVTSHQHLCTFTAVHCTHHCSRPFTTSLYCTALYWTEHWLRLTPLTVSLTRRLPNLPNRLHCATLNWVLVNKWPQVTTTFYWRFTPRIISTMFADDLGLWGSFLIVLNFPNGWKGGGLDVSIIRSNERRAQVMNVTRILFLRNMIVGIFIMFIVAFTFNVETCNAHPWL